LKDFTTYIAKLRSSKLRKLQANTTKAGGLRVRTLEYKPEYPETDTKSDLSLGELDSDQSTIVGSL
jgi:hypothetical protein